MYIRKLFITIPFRCVKAAAAGCIVTVLSVPAIHAGDPGYDIDALTAEQKQLANRMLEFIEATEKRHFEAMERLNGDLDIDERVFEFDHADYNIQVVRGDVIEKAGFTKSVTTAGAPPHTQPSTWSRVVQVNVHGKSPLVPYLLSFVAFSYDANGRSSIGGWMDVVPGAYVEEDVVAMRRAVDKVFEKHGVDGTSYRKALHIGPREHLQSAQAGVSFYAQPFLSITAENFDVVTETFSALFDAYIAVAEKHAGQDYSAEDLAAQDAMRRRWIVDQMLIDPFAKNVIPYEVRTFQNYPPTVKY